VDDSAFINAGFEVNRRATRSEAEMGGAMGYPHGGRRFECGHREVNEPVVRSIEAEYGQESFRKRFVVIEVEALEQCCVLWNDRALPRRMRHIGASDFKERAG